MTPSPAAQGLPDDVLERLEALDKAATQGPWSASRTDMDSFTFNPESGEWDRVAYLYRHDEQRAAFFGDHNRDDLALVTVARNALPALLQELRAARAVREALELARGLVSQKNIILTRGYYTCVECGGNSTLRKHITHRTDCKVGIVLTDPTTKGERG